MLSSPKIFTCKETYEKRNKEEKSPTRSAHELFETRMESPDAKKGRPWNLQKNLPSHIKVSVIEQRAKIEERREMVKLLSNHPTNEKKFVFLVVNILDGSYSPIGYSKLFDTKVELFEFCLSIGREKVKIGKDVFDAAMEIENEAARIEAAQATKNNYIKFGYWKQGD